MADGSDAIPHLEEELANGCEKLYESLMDLNVPISTVNREIVHVTRLRTKIIDLYTGGASASTAPAPAQSQCPQFVARELWPQQPPTCGQAAEVSVPPALKSLIHNVSNGRAPQATPPTPSLPSAPGKKLMTAKPKASTAAGPKSILPRHHAPSTPQHPPGGIEDFKTTLRVALFERFGPTLQAEFRFTASQVSGGRWRALVEADGLAKQYIGIGSDQEDAEQKAARLALQAEFPEVLQSTTGGSKAGHVKQPGVNAAIMSSGLQNGVLRQAGALTAPAVGGLKRPVAVQQQVQFAELQEHALAYENGVEAMPQQNHKSALITCFQVLVGQLVKGDISYQIFDTTDEAGNAGYTATVQVPDTEFLEGNLFQGEMCATKKEAEQSAAQWALAVVEPIALPIMEERKASKKRR